ncbi:FAD-binding oxidoreductase [Sphingomonas sp.]|uniref:FAD-binding oxidoreductase n=1 Tax=Sphingomonas sp. TaxID=28214 RepID=UPI000DB7DAFA|nr:FAD-dependent oxidoreductase [Sphingomonas sp.]PZU10986.1 MAG: FAD-binding oxidoreductase [Sphingomonas sp.]
MIPSGVSASDWTKALAEFRTAVGPDWVFTSDEDVALYRDAYSPEWGEPTERLVSAAIAPVEREQVQAIVRTANRYRIPIYPVSTGKNLGYGGSAPNLSGSVVLDLKRMRKIVEVNDKRHFAIVEPGVSYFDLHHHIRANKLRSWIDCPDPGWGSLVGNALDHGVGHTLTSYRDHFQSHCGMEIVLPNGELMRTGMAALPGSETWADFRYGFGPHVDGLFGQGNFGVVTKMGFHLMPQPEAYLSREVLLPRRKDIIALTEIVNELEYLGIIGMPEYSSPLAPFRYTNMDTELKALLARPDSFTTDIVDEFAARRGRAVWAVKLQFYGAPEGICANWENARSRLEKVIPGLRVGEQEDLRFPLTDEQEQAVGKKVLVGIPNMNVFSLGARSDLNPQPRDGHLLFTPIIPKDGESILKAQSLFADALRGTDLETVYSAITAPYTWIYRAFVLAAGFPVSRGDSAINRRSRDAMRRLIDLGAAHGYGEYRTPPLFQDQVAGTYGFNDGILRRFSETLKDAVDPNGIIAAGRGGIWPRHLRKA